MKIGFACAAENSRRMYVASQCKLNKVRFSKMQQGTRQSTKADIETGGTGMQHSSVSIAFSYCVSFLLIAPSMIIAHQHQQQHETQLSGSVAEALPNRTVIKIVLC